ncbi:CotH kinase family protein [Rubrolithibacter danxiaensis]|uniref:CotH kinase family protein n=1 Tax=Rubrolithibacter danxiaensis TaxID=3390805 RepID=UPI003BF80922
MKLYLWKNLLSVLLITVSISACKKDKPQNNVVEPPPYKPDTTATFTGLPVFNIRTVGPVTSKEDYVSGSLSINTNSLYEQETTQIALQIKGRGNSTWFLHPKKPYRLKFKEKAKVLGLPAAKNWVLLANYSDKTLMRTGLAFELGKQMQADFTPDVRYVEVFMNGEYLGNYTLTQQVEVNENRVNIKELKPENTAEAEITGGYLVELDERKDEENLFTTDRGLPMTVKEPEDITEAQFNYIKNYIQLTENVLFSPDFADPQKGYAKYINVDSFINWFLIEELFKNQDSQKYSSMFYYKDRGGKLGMGPIWDFDLSIGNVDYSDATYPTGWWVKDGLWFKRLFEDPAFRKKVKKRWDEIKVKEVPAMFTYIDSTAKYLQKSQEQNFSIWPILNMKVWPNPVVLGTYPAEVNHIKEWLTTRIDWLDANIEL